MNKQMIVYICFTYFINIFINKMIFILLTKFNGLILLYCLTYMSFSRVSGAYEHKMQKGKVLYYGKSYARD